MFTFKIRASSLIEPSRLLTMGSDARQAVQVFEKNSTNTGWPELMIASAWDSVSTELSPGWRLNRTISPITTTEK